MGGLLLHEVALGVYPPYYSEHLHLPCAIAIVGQHESKVRAIMESGVGTFVHSRRVEICPKGTCSSEP